MVGVLGFNYFFLPPVDTFTIEDPQNWVALGAFLVTAVTASQLSARARRRAAEAEARRREIEQLYALVQAMMLSGSARKTIRRVRASARCRFSAARARRSITAPTDELFRSGPETKPG